MPIARRLLLYTKPAIPGRVKTRLTPDLTPEQAAELHAAFVDDLVERLVAGRFDLWIAWALRAGEEPPVLPAPGAVPGLRQTGSDLGQRLYRGLSAAALGERGMEAGASVVAAFGSDHPTVPLETLHRAFERVEAGIDVVLGPSLDGGYYLVALGRRAVVPELFRGIDWSTDRVLRQTVERVAAAGLSHELLEQALDVDTPDDLCRLAADLARSGPSLCPRTHRLLDAWGRLPPGPATPTTSDKETP